MRRGFYTILLLADIITILLVNKDHYIIQFLTDLIIQNYRKIVGKKEVKREEKDEIQNLIE